MAQDDGDIDEGYRPKKGDITAAILFGRANVVNQGITLPKAAGTGSWVVGNNTPQAGNISLENNLVTNMIGVEGRYFFADNISAKASGGVIITYTPGQPNIPGYISNGPNATWLPAYASIPEQGRTDLNINIGGEYGFDSKLDRVYPWVELRVPFYYTRVSEYDPAILDDLRGGGSVYGYLNGGGTAGGVDELDGSFDGIEQGSTGDPNAGYQNANSVSSTVIYDLGVRTGEIFAVGVQLNAGVDYYLMEGLFMGLEIKPASWIYAYSASKPGPGLELQQSNTNTFAWLTQPVFKLGFKF